MSTQILAEICPSPECNLSPKDVEQFVEELQAYHEQFTAAFRRPEQARWSEVYLRGLPGDSPRKTMEQIALDLGVNVRDFSISSARVSGSRNRLWQSISGWWVRQWASLMASR